MSFCCPATTCPFEPGGSTGADGETRELVQRAGSPYLGRAGTEHDVVNASGAGAVFVEIELKR
jgi:hypothetical protein